VQASIAVLIALTGVMLLALFSRTPPHPPLEVAPFALAPFLGASLAIGTAAFILGREGSRGYCVLAIVFAATALVSFGPQKYFDPAFSRIWPAIVTAQCATVIVVVRSALAMAGRRPSSRLPAAQQDQAAGRGDHQNRADDVPPARP
jgi:hypothetical protein